MIEAIEGGEEQKNGIEQKNDRETVMEKVGEIESKEKAGKTKVSLAEEEKGEKWAEQEVTVWEEDINEEGVHWFSSVVAYYERKRAETRRKEIERIRTQGLIRDFTNLSGRIAAGAYTRGVPTDAIHDQRMDSDTGAA